MFIMFTSSRTVVWDNLFVGDQKSRPLVVWKIVNTGIRDSGFGKETQTQKIIIQNSKFKIQVCRYYTKLRTSFILSLQKRAECRGNRRHSIGGDEFSEEESVHRFSRGCKQCWVDEKCRHREDNFNRMSQPKERADIGASDIWGHTWYSRTIHNWYSIENEWVHQRFAGIGWANTGERQFIYLNYLMDEAIQF